MIPIKLEIKNFQSHSDSVIDFEKFNSAIILGCFDGDFNLSNGSGKSAILEALSWALFDKTRHKKKDRIVKHGTKEALVKFYFSENGKQYVITRRRDKIMGESNVIFEEILENGKVKRFTADTNKVTNSQIQDIIKIDYKVFINSVYFKQNDISMFAESTALEKKLILKSLLKLDLWDKYEKAAKTKADAIGAKISLKSSLSKDIEELKIALTKNEQTIGELKDSIKINNEKLATSTEELIRTNIELEKINNPELKSRLLQYKSNLDLKHAKDKSLSAKKNVNEKQIEKDRLSLEKLNKNILSLEEIIEKSGDINLAEAEKKIGFGQEKEIRLKNKIISLENNLDFYDTCDKCGNNLSKEEAKAIKDKIEAEIISKKQEHAVIVKKLSSAKRSLTLMKKSAEEAGAAKTKKERASWEISSIEANISNLDLQNKDLIIRIEDNRAEIVDTKTKIKEIEDSLDVVNIKNLTESVENLSKKIKYGEINKNKMVATLGSEKARNLELKEEIKTQENLKIQITKLKNEQIMYNKMKGYFGRDGVQSVIIENIIEELENYANDILSRICTAPTLISIKTQKENDSGSWNETLEINIIENGIENDFESMSGGEQFRIALALRLALSNILSKRMGGTIKFLLLDEVSGNLDNNGLALFVKIIQELSKTMKVLVITHDEKLKNKFDSTIVVNRVGKNSTIE